MHSGRYHREKHNLQRQSTQHVPIVPPDPVRSMRRTMVSRVCSTRAIISSVSSLRHMKTGQLSDYRFTLNRQRAMRARAPDSAKRQVVRRALPITTDEQAAWHQGYTMDSAFLGVVCQVRCGKTVDSTLSLKGDVQLFLPVSVSDFLMLLG